MGPLLPSSGPSERSAVLVWEGSLIDPVGAILGAVIFHGIIAGAHHGFVDQLAQFLASMAVGLAGGAVGSGCSAGAARAPPRRGPRYPAQLAAVVRVAAGL